MVHLAPDQGDQILSQSVYDHMTKLLGDFDAEDAMPMVREALVRRKSIIIFDGLDEVVPGVA